MGAGANGLEDGAEEAIACEVGGVDDNAAGQAPGLPDARRPGRSG